jgi:hypothetical protein
VLAATCNIFGIEKHLQIRCCLDRYRDSIQQSLESICCVVAQPSALYVAYTTEVRTVQGSMQSLDEAQKNLGMLGLLPRTAKFNAAFETSSKIYII